MPKTPALKLNLPPAHAASSPLADVLARPAIDRAALTKPIESGEIARALQRASLSTGATESLVGAPPIEVTLRAPNGDGRVNGLNFFTPRSVLYGNATDHVDLGGRPKDPAVAAPCVCFHIDVVAGATYLFDFHVRSFTSTGVGTFHWRIASIPSEAKIAEGTYEAPEWHMLFACTAAASGLWLVTVDMATEDAWIFSGFSYRSV